MKTAYNGITVLYAVFLYGVYRHRKGCVVMGGKNHCSKNKFPSASLIGIATGLGLLMFCCFSYKLLLIFAAIMLIVVSVLKCR